MLNARVNREPLNPRGRVATLALLLVAVLPLGLVSLSAGASAREQARDVTFAPANARPTASAPPQPATTTGARPVTVAPRASAPAQSASGVIQGVLYDQFGGLLPGASAVAVHTDSGARYDMSTDPNGAFAFRLLPPGDYELTTSLPGFVPVKNVVRVTPGASVARQITLPIGTVEETIHVTCGGPQRDAPRQSRGQRVLRVPTPSLFTGGIGGQIKAPTKTLHVGPVCPGDAQRVPNAIKLAGRIGIDGLITDLRSMSDGYQPALVASAMEAARQWEFTPTLLNNVPIEVNLQITVSFSWER
jgi:hypothetical protein